MTPFPLNRSSFSTKVLITIFFLSILTAFAIAELNVYDKVGRIKDGVAARYGPDTPTDENSLPTEVLPSETDIPLARLNTFSSLLDITHPHIFEIPLIIFVIAHFLMRTNTPEWFKLSNYLLSFLGTTSFISAPWAVRYISLKTAWLLYFGAILIGITVLVMIVVSLWDMWMPPKKPNASH